MANEFTGDSNNIDLKKYNFLPSLEIKILHDSEERRKNIDSDNPINIFDQPKISGVKELTIDLKKLSQYIKVVLKARFRDSNG